METRAQSASPFLSGFVNGAKSGAMMMGIFNGLMAVAFVTGLYPGFALGSALFMMGVGTVSTGLFSGYTASQRAKTEAHSASRAAHPVSTERAPARAPEHSLTDEPDLTQAVEQQTRWADQMRTRGSHGDRVAEILADGRAAKDHAQAILAVRVERGDSATAR